MRSKFLCGAVSVLFVLSIGFFVQKRCCTPSAPPRIHPNVWTHVQIHVLERDTELPLPARITLVKASGKPALFRAKPRIDVVIRPYRGLLYILDRPYSIRLPPGRYTLYASRGMEWSLARRQLDLTKPKEKPVTLSFKLHREVDTKGYIAADTHIHTRTFSDHGDITVQERMISIAGEGIELAVATDHNVRVDYRPYQRVTKTLRYFSSIAGNEVGSTHGRQAARGHINIFPIGPQDPKPSSPFEHWRQLQSDIRKTQAQISILNHPRWPLTRSGEPSGPFSLLALNSLSGEFKATSSLFPFEALEVINADTAVSKRQTRPLRLFKDWFSLLNRGYSIAAVGGSDSHTAHVPVGQARTYIPLDTVRPDRIPIQRAIQNIKQSQSSVSMGIFVRMSIQGHGIGQTVHIPATQHTFTVQLDIAAPSWVRPRTVSIFVNGRLVMKRPIASKPKQATRERISFSLKRPQTDAYIVAYVQGDPVTQIPFYTGELMRFERYTMGATNPIFLNVDGDGHYTSPRQTALYILRTLKNNTKVIQRYLLHPQTDPMVGVQLLSALQTNPRFESILQNVALHNPTYAMYQKSLSTMNR